MSFRRPQKHRQDNNQGLLLELAETIGIKWVKAPPLDGWAWHVGLSAWHPVEIKDPKREGHANEYTVAQRKFIASCRMTGAPYFTWRVPADVMRFRQL